MEIKLRWNHISQRVCHFITAQRLVSPVAITFTQPDVKYVLEICMRIVAISKYHSIYYAYEPPSLLDMTWIQIDFSLNKRNWSGNTRSFESDLSAKILSIQNYIAFYYPIPYWITIIACYAQHTSSGVSSYMFHFKSDKNHNTSSEWQMSGYEGGVTAALLCFSLNNPILDLVLAHRIF